MPSTARGVASLPAEKIRNDEYLSALYQTAYGELRRLVASANHDRTVEVGAGLGLATLFGQRWIKSDVTGSAPLEVLNVAEALPYRTSSLEALVLKDTWHHIPNIEQFLGETHRVLRPGGMVAVFDPYWGVLARTIYRYLHQEDWDDSTREWSFRSTNPWDSNQALTYLMLKRDRAEFEKRWGSRFNLVEPRALVGPSFLLSGGVSRRTVVSGRWLAALLRWEEARGRWLDHLRFFHVFGLVKK